MRKYNSFFIYFYTIKQRIMKKILNIFLFLSICFLAGAQEIVTVSGRVIDSDSSRPVPAASVNLDGTNISIITNSEGDFSLNMPVSLAQGGRVVISHLGYVISVIPVSDFPEGDKARTIRLVPMSLELDPAVVRAVDPLVLFRTAYSRVKENYPAQRVGMTTFYREMIRKDNSKYLVLNEAIVDVDKGAYTGFGADRAAIYKGRGSVNVNRADTLFVKFQGGITTALAIDMVKNPFLGLDLYTACEAYTFVLGDMANIDDRPFYTLDFTPRKREFDYMYSGRLYIDMESYAIARVEFDINLSDWTREDAAKLFIVSTPTRTRFSIDHASYVVNYKQSGDKWYFDYSKIDLGFHARKTRSLFRHYYQITSEMAVTDHKDEALIIEGQDRVRTNAILTDDIQAYEDPDFWEGYNIIQPEQSIQNAIQRIIRQLNRRR